MSVLSDHSNNPFTSKCPVCSGTELQHPYQFEEFFVLRCPACESSWRSNMYNDDKLKEIYCSDEYEAHPYFDRDREDEDSLALQRYVNYERGLRFLERDGRIGRLLDVGSGSGTVLALGKRNGWDVSGVEMSAGLAKRSADELGVPVFIGPFEDAPFAEGSFDALTFWDIIEHVVDPVSVIKKARDLLKPGGLVLFCTPDEQSWLARIGMLLYKVGYAYPSLALHPPNHTYFFCRTGFRSLLEECGFDVIEDYCQSAFFEHSPLASNVQKLGIQCIESVSRIAQKQYEMVFVARKSA